MPWENDHWMQIFEKSAAPRLREIFDMSIEELPQHLVDKLNQLRMTENELSAPRTRRW
jgi:hypothetical protein